MAMNNTLRGWGAARWGVLLVSAFLVAGCQTRTQTQWDSRVGVYTYDQAVQELGPPERSTKLADGSTVVEWITRRGYTKPAPSAGVMYGSGYPYGSGPLVANTYSPPSVVRLTFGPDHKLSTWKKIMR